MSNGALQAHRPKDNAMLYDYLGYPQLHTDFLPSSPLQNAD